jgi:aryl-alcohol dehydrogenase-like predicted oxidoreductase
LTEALRLSAGGMAPVETIQPVYNLVRREIESDILPLCAARGIAPVIYSPLGAGFLAGKYRPDAAVPEGTRFQVIPGHADEYFSRRNFRIVEKLRVLAERLGIPTVRLALGWVLNNPAICGALIGARGPEHIDNALAALEMELAPDIVDEMSAWGTQQE